MSKPKDDAGGLYDAVRELAKNAGKEKAFVAELDERKVFLEKCGEA